jgi:hypothetical protein
MSVQGRICNAITQAGKLGCAALSYIMLVPSVWQIHAKFGRYVQRETSDPFCLVDAHACDVLILPQIFLDIEHSTIT